MTSAQKGGVKKMHQSFRTVRGRSNVDSKHHKIMWTSDMAAPLPMFDMFQIWSGPVGFPLKL